MTSRKTYLMGTAIIALTAGAAYAGEIEAFIDWSGGGYVLLDEDENVVAPGIAVYTDDLNNDDFTTGNGFSPQGALNCIRSNQVPLTNPENPGCQQGPATGNRYKLRLDARNPFDLQFDVAPSGGITEYFNFGKVTNETDARILSFDMVLGTGTGSNFTIMDASDPNVAVLFDNLTPVTPEADAQWNDFLGGETDGQNPLQRVFFPGGLFGSGGQEGAIGFFDTERAAFVAIQNADGTIINISNLTQAGGNTFYRDNFGTALIATNMLPDGIFWDENDDPSDESSLIAWFDHSRDAWVWGNLSIEDGTDGAYTYAQLAEALGVTETELVGAIGSTDREALAGTVIPAELLAAIEENPAFEIGAIEDLANLNLNFNIDAGDIALGEFTLRIVPRFAQIVEETATEYQFRVAASLDAANVPYLGADPIYLSTISNVLAIADPDEQNQALERLGFSFLGAYADLGFNTAQEQVYAVRAGAAGSGGSADVARNGSWFSLGDGARGLVSLSGSMGDVERTTNGIGYDFQLANLSAGLEFPMENGVTGGVLLGVSKADADIDDDRGSLDQQALSIAAFGRGEFDENGSFEAIAGYQSLSFDSTRTISAAGVSETAEGSTDGSVFFAAVSGDYMFNRGRLAFGPTGAFEYYKVSVDGFNETGAGAYNIQVGEQDTSLAVARLGVRAEGQFDTNAGAFRPYGQLGVASRSSDDALIETSFGGVLPGLTPIDGADNTWVDVGLGFSVEAGRSGSTVTSFGMDYRGAIGDDYENHSARLFLEVSF